MRLFDVYNVVDNWPLDSRVSDKRRMVVIQQQPDQGLMVLQIQGHIVTMRRENEGGQRNVA